MQLTASNLLSRKDFYKDTILNIKDDFPYGFLDARWVQTFISKKSSPRIKLPFSNISMHFRKRMGDFWWTLFSYVRIIPN